MTTQEAAQPQPGAPTAAEAVVDASPDDAIANAIAAMDGTPAEGEPEAEPAAPGAAAPAPDAAAQPAEPAPAEGEPATISASEYLARLTAQDRELRVLRGQIRQQQDGQGPTLESMRQLAQQNPMQAMQELGMNFDQILDAWSQQQPEPGENGQPSAPPDEHAQKIAELQQQFQQLQQQQRSREDAKAIDGQIDRINAMVSDPNAGDRWEMINAYSRPGSLGPQYDCAPRLVFQVMFEMWNQSNRTVDPDMSVAADRVEQHLIAEEQRRYQSFSKHGKFRKIYGGESQAAPVPNATPAVAPGVQPVIPSPQSVSTPEPAPPMNGDEADWTEEQYIARAMAAMKEPA